MLKIFIKQNWFLFILIAIFSSFLSLNTASAHPGNTDYRNCHTCYTNCASWDLLYEQYHCHTEGYYYDGSCEDIFDQNIPMPLIESQYKECLYQNEKNFYKQYSTPAPTPSPTPTPSCGQNSYYNSLYQICTCNPGYGKSTDGTCKAYTAICIETYGQDSWYNPTDKLCYYCSAGYKLVGGKCLSTQTPTPTLPTTPIFISTPTPTSRPTITPTHTSIPTPTPTRTITPKPINKDEQKDKTVANTATASYNETVKKDRVIVRMFKFFWGLFK